MSERNEYARLLHEDEAILWEGRPEKRLLPPRRTLMCFLLILALVVLFIPWASDDWDSLPALLAIMGGFMLFFLLLLTIEIRLRTKTGDLPADRPPDDDRRPREYRPCPPGREAPSQHRPHQRPARRQELRHHLHRPTDKVRAL